MNDNDDDQKPVEEKKQPSETDRKPEAPLTLGQLKKLGDLLQRPIVSGSLNDEASFRQLWALLLAGNPFYLISAGLILYASTVVSDTANIWLETGIPIGILAGYTVLCAATAIFIVTCGKVWCDARSLLFVILMLPLALSAGLDDKLLSTPGTGIVWLTGSALFTAGVFCWVKRGLGIRLNPGLWWIFAGLLAVFFFWPLLLSRLVIDYPDDRNPVRWGIILFPFILSAAALPLLRLVNRGRFAPEENGTPWKRLAPCIFVLLGIAAVLRSYLLSISFYPAQGVGGYSRLESGFGTWMLLPFLLVSVLLIAEWLIVTRKGNPRLLILTASTGGICLLALATFAGQGQSESLAGNFYRTFWKGVPTVAAAFSPFFLLLVYMACRRVKWAAWLAGVILLGVGAYLLFRNVTLPKLSRDTIEYSVFTLISLLFAVMVLWFRHRWVTLAFLWWLCMISGGLLLHYDYLPNSAPVISVAIAATLAVGWSRRDRFIEAIGLTAAAFFFAGCLFWTVTSSGWESVYYLFGNYIVVLLFVIRRHWIAATVETGLLLLWGVLEIYRWLYHLEIRGAGVIFWGLLFFAAAFLISLWKGGILQRKASEWCGPVFHFFREKP